MEARSSSGVGRSQNTFPCVVGDKYPEFCNQSFPTIEKHNEHIKKYHSPEFWCATCSHKFNVSLAKEPLRLAKREHERICPGQSLAKNRELRSKAFIISQEQLERFNGGSWKKTRVSNLTFQGREKEGLPERSWRQIRETIFPDSDTNYLSEEQSRAAQAPTSSISGLPDNDISSYVSHAASLQSDSGYGSIKRDEQGFQLPDISEEGLHLGFPSDTSGDDLPDDVYDEHSFQTIMAVLEEEAEPWIRNALANRNKMVFFSFAPRIPADNIEGWKRELPKKLHDDLSLIDPAFDSMGKLSDAVSSLLPSFFLRLGSFGPQKAEMEAILLLFKRRDIFSAVFRKLANKLCHNKPVRDKLLSMESDLFSAMTCEITPDDNSAVDTILKWISNVEREGIPTVAQPVTADLSRTTERRSIIDNRELIFNSVAYRWLIARLSQKLALNVIDVNLDVPDSIYQDLMICFKHSGYISTDLSYQYRMTFTADWNPTEFLNLQFGSECDTSRLLGEILTLTGTATDAQILPCSKYLNQTWPTTGLTFLELLGDTLVSGKAVSGELQDKTHVRCDFTESGLQVDVRGFADTIAIIGEQIGWLGAAIRPSCSDSGFSICQPIFKSQLEGMCDSKCSFTFPTIPIDLAEDTPGQCWHAIFRNPVIVKGYPIPRRKRYGSGLEMPLNVMAGLNSSPRIHKYRGSYYLKGYSTVLVATEKIDNMVLWHLYYSDDGSRLPYPDSASLHCADLRMRDLTAARHVVGWCSNAKFMTGAAGVNYDIKASQLQRPGKEFALEKVSFSFGQFVTGGCQFAIGRKDQHVRATKGTYIDKLKWLDKKYVTLWDVDDERGWLVNGNAALLHLLRSSLHHSSTDKFSSDFHFQPQNFQESKNLHTLDSALEVLRNSKNQQLELYDKDIDIRQGCATNSRTTVKDRVEELYEILEKLFDHTVTSEASSKGLNAKSRFQDHLEGWDFKDIATSRDPFFTKRVTLGLSMLGWPDLTRAVSAITLFGKGFGDLIKATGTQGGGQCKEWMTVPKNRNLLCVSSGHLRDIINDEGGNLDTNPVTVVPGLLWKVPSSINPFDMFCQCETRERSPRKHHAIQNLISQKLLAGNSQARVNLDDYCHGAVIFGPLIDWKRPWGSTRGISRSGSQSSSLSALGGSTTSPQTDSNDLASSSSSFPAS